VNTIQSLKNSDRKLYTVPAGSHTISLGLRTHIMGIVNVTPDSFSRDGCWNRSSGPHQALALAQKHISEGADIIDVGGESTRPGARKLTVKDELARVLPVITLLAKKIHVPISIDTYKPTVAKAALDAGAVIVNNIMGTRLDQRFCMMVKNYHATIALMHMQGMPKTMQKNIRYTNLITEIIDALNRTIEKCLESGIKSDRIIVDPGIGFGKTVEHNVEILNRLEDFKILDRPLLIGTSRKSFIGTILKREVQHRLFGTAATVCTSILKGAHIVRVHDVKAIKDVTTMTDTIINGQYN